MFRMCSCSGSCVSCVSVRLSLRLWMGILAIGRRESSMGRANDVGTRDGVCITGALLLSTSSEAPVSRNIIFYT